MVLNFKNFKIAPKCISIPFVLFGLTSIPQLTSATPLGEHTICAYPACTSQAEVNTIRSFIRTLNHS
jgi:hypothetical protein